MYGRSHLTYDTLTEDLRALIEALDLTDATLVDFSRGGGDDFGPDKGRRLRL
ncbi:hypothetical protein [Arthrobacter sp. TMN-50]